MSLNLTLDMTIPGGSIHVHFTDLILAELGPEKAESLRVLVSDLLAIGSDTDAVPATVAEEPPSAPTPPVEPPPAPKAATSAPKRTGASRGGRPKATGGTCSHAILNAVADAGGSIPASASSIGIAHGTGTEQSKRSAAADLVRDGLLTTVPRTGPTRITEKGWAFIGRTAPAKPADTSTKPELAAVPDPPAMPDLGPIERRPFDPDRVRQQQAEAL